MKPLALLSRTLAAPLALTLLSTTIPQLSTAFAQGTAFTYQGRLDSSGTPASGSYDLRFTIYDASGGGGFVAGPLTNAPTSVSNGLFTVTLDFGNQFPGADRWLEIGARTNGGGAFATLSPRQKLTPTPYAIMASSASNLLGTLPAGQLSGSVLNGQLANNSIAVLPGTGLSGGGTVALGDSTTLNNAGVLSVTGNADITAFPTFGAVTLGDTATDANTPSRIVKRDGNGDFSAGTITLNTNLNLPATTATAGIVYLGGQTVLHDYGVGNFFVGPGAGNLTMSGVDNTGVGASALGNNTTGNYNTASGLQALFANDTGSFNTANGFDALLANTSGSFNTANGFDALLFNKSGSNNTANGSQALFHNTDGDDNIANGFQALYNNTDGSDNIANGFQALYNNTSGYENTAIGFQALFQNTSGGGNIAIGSLALYSTTNGYNNIAGGFQALFSNKAGSDNIAIGYKALQNHKIGVGNLAYGTRALQSITTNSQNTAIGFESLRHNASGQNNIALGSAAGSGIERGDNNIYIGNIG